MNCFSLSDRSLVLSFGNWSGNDYNVSLVLSFVLSFGNSLIKILMILLTRLETCTNEDIVEVPSSRPTPSNPNLPTPAKSLASERASNYIH